MNLISVISEPTNLNTAHDGGGEGGVVLRAQQDGVHQNEAARHVKEELDRSRNVGYDLYMIHDGCIEFTP